MPNGELDLAQAVGLVLERNPGLQMAAARILRAEALVAESRAPFRPQIQFAASYQLADAPSAYLFKTIDARQFRPGTNFNDPGAFQNWEAGLNFGYKLYAGGVFEQGTHLAEAERALGELGRQSLTNHLTAATLQAYFGISAAKQQIVAAASSLSTVRAQRQEEQALFEEGRVLKADLLSLDVRFAEAEEQKLAAEHALQLARVGLATLLAIPEAELPPLAAASEDALGMLPRELGAALEAAARRRPELAQARTRVDQAEMRVRQADGSKMPQVDLFGKVWADNPQVDFDGSEPNWSVGLALSWSLFDGGARDARRAQASAGRMAMEAADRQAWLDVQADVQRAWLALADATAREQVTDRAVTAAEESLRLVQLQYQAGSATVTRYLEAEQMRTAARVRRIQAKAARALAAADLQRATGALRDGLRPGISPTTPQIQEKE